VVFSLSMIAELIYIIFCFWLAYNNSQRIKADKIIYHGWQGFTHIATASLLAWFVNWIYFPLILLTARLFFTTALNFFRHKPMFFVTPKPTAFIDGWEQAMFGRRGEQPLLIYLFCWLICNLILLLT
jgi:hypothetical protein